MILRRLSDLANLIKELTGTNFISFSKGRVCAYALYRNIIAED